MLIGALSAGVPPVTGRNDPETDPSSCEDSLVEFHTQAGLTDKSWILFDSGACTNCCPEWIAPDYPVSPLNESAHHCVACREKHWKCKVERLYSLTAAMVIR